MNKCLYCYEQLDKSEVDFHIGCSRKMFGPGGPPPLPYSEKDLESLAKKIIQSHIAVTGVQAKLSLHIVDDKNDSNGRRFTLVGLEGGYILKPPSEHYLQLPEVEDLTMHLASSVKIKTAPHSLIRMASGSLAYITRRIDRTKKSKLAMEDMCQLTGRLTEDKYHGSYEQIAKAIQLYSGTPVLDVINFFELTLFCFLTGNADMHLKNFSLLEHAKNGMVLSPAYDLVNTTLVNAADEEELALSLNGKKRKIKRQDFINAMTTLKISDRQQQSIFSKMEKALPKWIEQIDRSFLTDDFKLRYKQILLSRFEKVKA